MNPIKQTKMAQEIADIITQVDTDFRGDLFFEIGTILRRNTQAYTGSLFARMAQEYGLNEPTGD